MALVPVYRTGSEDEYRDTDIVEWNNDSLSLWDSFFPHGTLLDPFPLMDSFQPFHLWYHSSSSLFARDAEAVRKTHLDWWESSEAHIIQADLPGVTKDDVEVLVENGKVLQISGRSRNGGAPPPPPLSGGRIWRRERSSSGYLRRISLPGNADAQQLKAELQNGVLTVTIPKRFGSVSGSEEVRVVEIQE